MRSGTRSRTAPGSTSKQCRNRRAGFPCQIRYATLLELDTRVLEAAGSPRTEAAVVPVYLLETDTRGVPSRGYIRFEAFAERLRRGGTEGLRIALMIDVYCGAGPSKPGHQDDRARRELRFRRGAAALSDKRSRSTRHWSVSCRVGGRRSTKRASVRRSSASALARNSRRRAACCG